MFQALLYNAQLEAIHEFTSEDPSCSPSKFGMKSKKGPHSKLKSRGSGLNLDTKVTVDMQSRPVILFVFLIHFFVPFKIISAHMRRARWGENGRTLRKTT